MTGDGTTAQAETAETEAEAAVQIEGVSHRYRRSLLRGGGSTALDGCTGTVPAGSVAALIGANGAGKTTLLSVLAGLLAPDTGRVHVRGRTAFVSQDKAVYRQLTPRQMVQLGARLNRVFDSGRALDWLHRFHVPTDRNCGRLSGGQQAQVAFAVALGSCPDVLLLDEPLANLDPLVRREVTAELLDQAAATGMTIVLSTHVVAELGGVADHLLLLAHGQLIAADELDTLLSRHVRYTGPPADTPPGPGQVIEARHHQRQSSFLARLPVHTPWPQVAEPWMVTPVTLEDYVLAHLATTRTDSQPASTEGTPTQ